MTTTPVIDLPLDSLKVNGEHDYETGVENSLHEFIISGPTRYLGGVNGHSSARRWTPFVCNDPECPAEVLVPTAMLEDAVNAAVTVSIG